MKITPAVRLTRDSITIAAGEIEAVLQGPPLDVKPFAPRSVELKNQEGETKTMLIREAKPEETATLLRLVAGEFLREESPEDVPDYRDLAGARVYAEILGWRRRRIKDPYILVGLCDGEPVALANGRLLNREINIGFHTLSFLPGFRAGAAMNYARCQYCFEDLGQDELWVACETPLAWKIWALDLALPSYPWPDLQHELGGGRVYYLSRDYWESAVRDHLARSEGVVIEREPARSLLAENEIIRLPSPPEPLSEPVKPQESETVPPPEIESVK